VVALAAFALPAPRTPQTISSTFSSWKLDTLVERAYPDRKESDVERTVVKTAHETAIERRDKKAKKEQQVPKISFTDGAAKRLDDLELHGKARKEAKKYHKNVMKAEMETNNAVKGVVVSTSHEGGTVKHEKEHITAKFVDPQTQRYIPSEWTDQKTGQVKKSKSDMHHVYPDRYPNIKAPNAWNVAVAESKARKTKAEKATQTTKRAEREKISAENKAAGRTRQESVAAGRSNSRNDRQEVELGLHRLLSRHGDTCQGP